MTGTSRKVLPHHRPPNDQRARELLLWARREKLSIGHIVVGDVTISGITDLGLSAALTPADAEKGKQSLYQQFGGAALEEATAEEGGATIEDDDD